MVCLLLTVAMLGRGRLEDGRTEGIMLVDIWRKRLCKYGEDSWKGGLQQNQVGRWSRTGALGT